MKRFLSVLIALTMIVSLVPMCGSAASNVLYNIDAYGELPALVRLDGSESFGIGGRASSDFS